MRPAERSRRDLSEHRSRCEQQQAERERKALLHAAHAHPPQEIGRRDAADPHDHLVSLEGAGLAAHLDQNRALANLLDLAVEQKVDPALGEPGLRAWPGCAP